MSSFDNLTMNTNFKCTKPKDWTEWFNHYQVSATLLGIREYADPNGPDHETPATLMKPGRTAQMLMVEHNAFASAQNEKIKAEYQGNLAMWAISQMDETQPSGFAQGDHQSTRPAAPSYIQPMTEEQALELEKEEAKTWTRNVAIYQPKITAYQKLYE